jgi:hypothetical protein
MTSVIRLGGFVAAVAILSAAPAWAAPFVFSTGNVTNAMAVASRPSAGGKTEREAADDFLLAQSTTITGASFTGLLVGTSAAPLSLGALTVEIYRVFPNDSNVGRTSGAPTFSTAQVPTRVNSPSDVAFDARSSLVVGDLSFTQTTLAGTFTAANSVLNGINPRPNQSTGGEGAVTGMEVRFDISFTNPLDLAADHYFFVPQVQVTNGEFYWLSAARPLVAPGTPFAPDLQSWVRSAALDPDWLRVGTDIVGGATPPTFNQAFTLAGTVATVPEPASWALMLAGLAALAGTVARAHRRNDRPRRAAGV